MPCSKFTVKKQPFRQESADCFVIIVKDWNSFEKSGGPCARKRIIGGLIVDNDHVSETISTMPWRADDRGARIKRVLVWAAVNLLWVRASHIFLYTWARSAPRHSSMRRL
jgi:hypothetical protein